MTLSQFLKRHKISCEQFGRLVGVDRITVWRWKSGKAFPIRHMEKITAKTGGKVTANDFFSGAK